MLKKYLQKYLPTADELKQNQRYKFLHKHILRPEFWHFNRSNVAKGVAVGIFIAFLPLPGQMLLAMIAAILVRANLPIAVMITWLNNPFTFIPVNLFTYKIGAWVLGSNGPGVIREFEMSKVHWGNIWSSFVAWIHDLGKPFLVGLPIVSIGGAILGYVLVNQIWRWSIKIRWHRRKTK